MNWYPKYYGDYTRDTAHLTLAEHGAYNVLLDHYYATGPLPDDIGMLMRICRAFEDHEKAAVKSVADKFFPVNGDQLRHNKRADIEISKRDSISQKRSMAGAKGAAGKWDSKRMANATTSTSTSTNTDTTKSKEDKNSSERSSIRSKPPVLQPDQVFISIPVTGSKDGNQEYPLSHTQVAEWEQLFPAVDVRQTLREIRAWNMANPKRRKTASGVVRHVASWLTKEQNKG